MKVEVVYATPAEQTIIELQVDEGATVGDAVSLSGLYQRYPSLQPGVTPVGIYGEAAQYDTALREGDRVEVYRPLEVDPMEARRLRARSQSTQAESRKGR